MYTIYRCVPLVWRSPGCVQFGTDDPVLIDGLSPADADLLNLLRMGISTAGLYDAAARCGVARERTASLLALLDEAGALVPVDTGPAGRAPAGTEALAAHLRAVPARVDEALAARRICVTGPLATAAQDALRRSGLRAASAASCEEAAADSEALVVLTAVWGPDLVGAGLLNEAGIAHAHLVLGQAQAEVGHPVIPGATPCTGCRVAAYRDADPEWLAAWQAVRALHPTVEQVDPGLVALATAHAAARLRMWAVAPDSRPEDTAVFLDGSVRATVPAFHPACDCRLPLSTTPEQSAWTPEWLGDGEAGTPTAPEPGTEAEPVFERAG